MLFLSKLRLVAKGDVPAKGGGAEEKKFEMPASDCL